MEVAAENIPRKNDCEPKISGKTCYCECMQL